MRLFSGRHGGYPPAPNRFQLSGALELRELVVQKLLQARLPEREHEGERRRIEELVSQRAQLEVRVLLEKEQAADVAGEDRVRSARSHIEEVRLRRIRSEGLDLGLLEEVLG